MRRPNPTDIRIIGIAFLISVLAGCAAFVMQVANAENSVPAPINPPNDTVEPIPNRPR